MILKRLNINRLPGIDSPFQVEFDGAEFHIIHGPNGVGKSSLCKAIERLYWNHQKIQEPISVTGHFEVDGQIWIAERDGTTLRWSLSDGKEAEAPVLPSPHQANCFFLRLRDLIDPSRDNLVDIATQINRQMAGGFDLDAVVASFPELTKHQRRNIGKTFSDACNDIEKEQKQQASLQSREDYLEQLRTNLDLARTSARRKASINRALGMIERQKELNVLKHEFDRYPSEIGQLKGDEEERIRDRQSELQKDSEYIKRLNSDLATAQEELERTQLSAVLDSETLGVQKSRADKLRELEKFIAETEKRISVCGGKLAAAYKTIGGSVNPARIYNLEEHAQLYEFLRKCIDIRNREEIIQSKISFLEKSITPQASEQDSHQLESALSALRMWLRAPSAESVQGLGSFKRNTKGGLIAGAILVLLGVILWLLEFPFFLFVAGAGSSLVAFAVYLRRLASHSPETSESREEAEAIYKSTGMTAPKWDMRPVKTLMGELEAQLSKLNTAVHYSQLQEREQEKLKHELEDVLNKRNELDVERRKLADLLELEDISDMELIDSAQALDRIRKIHIELEGYRSELAESQTRQTQKLEQLAAYITEHGENPPKDGRKAKASIESLSKRSDRLSLALNTKKSTLQQIERIKSEQGQKEQEIREIYARVSLDEGNMPKLRDMLEQRKSYFEESKEIAKKQSQNDLDLQELQSAGEADLGNHAAEELQKLKEQSLQAEQNLESISQEIAEINTLIKQAKSGHSMQDLISKREDARNELANSRETELLSHGVRFLIGQVKSQYEQKRMPRLLERAKSHFSRFTRHAYELQLDRHDGKPTLRALDLQSGKTRALDELSDGTRVQLLIAARMAFAEEIEKGKTLPFFLDEALDQSDPQRFEAIARSLGQVCANQNRQIVYLTSDPVDQTRINKALEQEDCELASAIDLGKIRNMSTAAGDQRIFELETGIIVPAPSGESFAKYLVKLGVPEFNPAQGWASQHFCYVLPEQTDLLYRFAKNGIQSAGQWNVIEDKPLVDELCGQSMQAMEVTNRIELLKTFCELWLLGRGRPVRRYDLEMSNAVSDLYIQGVSQIAREIQGDAAKLLDILKHKKDERASGFRQTKINQLEQYLLDNGHIEDRAVLERNELLLRARSTPAAHNLSEDISLELLNKWLILANRLERLSSYKS